MRNRSNDHKTLAVDGDLQLMPKHIKRIQALRAQRRRAAERHLKLHYRIHRRIRWGPLSSLVGRKRIQRLIFWGELEHRLYVAPVLLALNRMLDALKAWRSCL
ncbi:hypothetical protein V1281_006828 [Nitrobacteraceae bacterium AZCC 2161]